MAEASPEAEISSLLPKVHSYLVQTQTELNWSDVCTDMKALNWLQATMPRVASLCLNILQIVDILALSTLHHEPHYNVLRLNQVKLFITEAFDRFATIKSEMKESHSVVRIKIGDLGFFKQGAQHLLEQTNSDLPKETVRLVAVYEEMKEMLQCLFFHLKPSFQAETNRDIDDVLEEQFYRQCLEPVKVHLREHEEVADVLKKFDRNYSLSILSKPRSLISQMWNSNYSKDTIYYGEVNDAGQKHGYGRITYSNGDSYEGFWANDKYEGKGLYIWKDKGSYEGDFLAGKMHGEGKRVYQSGNVYRGDLAEGKKQGRGVMVYKNGDQYEGDWVDDCMHGAGTYTWSSGCTYTGSFVRDRREGKGRLVLAADDVHEGEWQGGRFRGA